MSQEFNAEPPKKTREQIEQEIERTRSALSEDIHALGEKLSPEHLKEGAKDVIREVKSAAADSIREARYAASDSIREARDVAVGSLREAKEHAFESVTETVSDIGRRAQRAGYATSDFVSTHAVPLTLVGLGVGWLMLSMNHQKKRESQGYLQSRHDRDYDRAPRGGFGSVGDWDRDDESYARRQSSSVAEEARQRASGLAQRAQHGIEETRHQVRETVQAARGRVEGTLSDLRDQASDLHQHASELGHDLRRHASDVGQQAYQQLQRAQVRTREFADENPLAVGALAVVAGVGVGLLLPATQRENQLLGQTRDRVMDEAQRTASRLGETVQRSASELRGALLEQPH